MAISQIVTNSIATGAVTDALLPAGSVLQVVQATYNTSTVFNSTTYTTLISASITPSASTSKVLAMVTANGQTYPVANTYEALFFALYRDATVVYGSEQAFVSANNDYEQPLCLNCSYLDSPNTTSSITYAFKCKVGATPADFRITDGTNATTLILMEIAA